MRSPWLCHSLCLVLVVSSSLCYAPDTNTVAYWNFGAEETTPITAHKGVQRDQAGPISPEFPDFSTTNTAVYLNGQGARFTLDDSGPDSPYDFTNGDSITLKEWVNVKSLRDGQNMYVIGKGRTNSPHFPGDNQNWAMRIVGAKGSAQLNFLFSTPDPSVRDHWHRWTSKKSFDIITGWHHVSVQYTFGDPKSIKGWVDGNATDGVWDMGTKATLYADRGRYELHPERNSDVEYQELVLGERPKGSDFFKKPNGTLLHMDNWLECIRTRKETNAPVKAGVQAAATAHLANKELREEKVIRS